MQGSKQLTLRRLQKEEQQLKQEPIPGVLVARDGHLDFHFVIYDLDGDFQGGYYHGLLQLHPNYPFNAPKLFFYTKNGRFQVNMAICTSFTNYHQESWTSAWNIRSLLLGTVSFMTCNDSSYGCRHDSSQIRREYAKNSLMDNFENPKFLQLFREDLKKIGVKVPQAISEIDDPQKVNSELFERIVEEGNEIDQPQDNFNKQKILNYGIAVGMVVAITLAFVYRKKIVLI